MTRILGAAGVALLVGAWTPSAAIATAGPDRNERSAQAAPSGQAGGRSATSPSADERKPRPGQVSASAEWEWWNDPEIRKQLGLSDDKTKRLEAIFRQRVADIQPWVDSLNRERDKLNRMTNDRLADERTYGLQVAKAEQLLSRFRESRTIMLYRMYRELQPEQYKKLQEISEKRLDQIRGRGFGGGR